MSAAAWTPQEPRRDFLSDPAENDPLERVAGQFTSKTVLSTTSR
jgi:hypothetical protein